MTITVALFQGILRVAFQKDCFLPKNMKEIIIFFATLCFMVQGEGEHQVNLALNNL